MEPFPERKWKNMPGRCIRRVAPVPWGHDPMDQELANVLPVARVGKAPDRWVPDLVAEARVDRPWAAAGLAGLPTQRRCWNGLTRTRMAS